MLTFRAHPIYIYSFVQSFVLRNSSSFVFWESLKMNRIVLSLLLPIFFSIVYGYANPMPCSGTCTNAHDPALIRRDDGVYFRFSTGGKIAIHSAPNITGPWTYKGAVVPKGSIINKAGRNDLWVCDHVASILVLRHPLIVSGA